MVLALDNKRTHSQIFFMKMVIVSFLIAFSVCLDSFGQGLVLDAGKTWSYEFTSLPFVGPYSLTPITPLGDCYFTFSDSDANNDNISIQMFENSTNQVPLFTSPPGITYGVASGAWQDLQGWVQFTVISGSVTLNSVQFDVFTPLSGPSLNHYSETIAVPEPNSLIFCLVGSFALTVLKLKKRGFSDVISRF
jgi:hypothetical protein